MNHGYCLMSLRGAERGAGLGRPAVQPLWLVDDGVPPNMVQRVLGHEHASTTLDLYTRRTDNADRILQALDDPDDDPDDEGLGGVPAPVGGDAPGMLRVRPATRRRPWSHSVVPSL